jgi:hypothetical protein
VAWPQRDKEEADSGMACTAALSSRNLRVYGLLAVKID